MRKTMLIFFYDGILVRLVAYNFKRDATKSKRKILLEIKNKYNVQI